MASFPWLHVLHRMCSSLRIFVLPRMTQRDSSPKYSLWIRLGGHARAPGQLAKLPARVRDPPALDPKLRGATHGAVSVAPSAPPAP